MSHPDPTRAGSHCRFFRVALLLEARIGEKFDAIVTGESDKGTWVRQFNPPVEGRLESGFQGFDVVHQLRVQLVNTDVERGFIDFEKVARASPGVVFQKVL